MTFSTSPAPQPRSGKTSDRRRFAAFDDDVFDFTCAGTAEGSRLLVFFRLEAGHAGLERGEFDDDEAVEFLRPLHDLGAAAARQHSALVLGNDGGHVVELFLVSERIDGARTRHPISRHDPSRGPWLQPVDTQAAPVLRQVRKPPIYLRAPLQSRAALDISLKYQAIELGRRHGRLIPAICGELSRLGRAPMARERHDYDDIPGTFVFDAERCREGYPINTFCMSLMKDANRKAFKADEAGYLKQFHMTPEQEQAILKRDYNRMLELGGNIYFTAKLGATDGHSFQHLAAVMTSNTQEDYAKMMLGGGRAVEGNRSRSGENTPSKFMTAGASAKKSAVKPKAKVKAKTKTKHKAKAKVKAKSKSKKRK